MTSNPLTVTWRGQRENKVLFALRNVVSPTMNALRELWYRKKTMWRKIHTITGREHVMQASDIPATCTNFVCARMTYGHDHRQWQCMKHETKAMLRWTGAGQISIRRIIETIPKPLTPSWIMNKWLCHPFDKWHFFLQEKKKKIIEGDMTVWAHASR